MPPRPASSLPHVPDVLVPRASDVALAREARPDVGKASQVRPDVGNVDAGQRSLRTRRARSIRWRTVLAAATALPLLITSLGAAPLSAAQREATDGSAALVLAAEGEAAAEGETSADPSPDPTEEPTPTPTPSPTPWPTPAGVKGLDVSHWNEYPNFKKLNNQDMQFVFSKASQGTSFVDDTYREHTRAARANGLLAGAYHFFDYNRDGVAQAQHFLSTVRKKTGLGSLLPLAVDVETLKSLGTPNTTKAKARLHAMLDELYRQTGRYPLIYTSRFMWSKVVGASTGFGQYPLWVACWKCDTVYLPSGWSDWTFWQVGQFVFSGGARLDGNVYAASYDRLRAERQRDARLEGGAEWTATRTVEADVRGFDGKDLRYANGDEAFGPWLPYQGRIDLKLTAKQGKQDVRIQLRSFRNVKSPVLTKSIRLDTKPPTVTGPKIAIRDGQQVPQDGALVPTTAQMSATDAKSGLESSGLTAWCDGKEVASRYRTTSSTGLSVLLDRKGCTLVARADDMVGHQASKKLRPTVRLRDARKNSSYVTFSRDWTVMSKKESLGKTIARTRAKGATARLAFDGAQFAVVARRGPSGGRFKVFVDGKHVDTVDLYSKTGDNRRIVYVRNVTKGKHYVRLQATGTKSRKSTGTFVWVDAFLVLDERK